MKKLLFGLLLSSNSFTFCSEQETRKAKEDNPIKLKTVGGKEITATENFLSQSTTIQNMQAAIGNEDTVIPLPHQYCTQKTIEQVNKFPFCEPENYNGLTLSRIIKCFLAGSYLNLINNSQLLPLIAEKFETSKNPAEKTNAQNLVNKDNILKDSLLGKWGSYYNEIKQFKEVNYYAISPDEKYVIITNTEGKGTIFNIEDKTSQSIVGQEMFYGTPIINSDSTLVASGGKSSNNYNTINIWNIKTGDIAFKLSRHTNIIQMVHFLPQNNLVVSTSYSNELKIWDLSKRECIATYSSKLDCITHPTKNIVAHLLPNNQQLQIINISEGNTAKINFDFDAFRKLHFSPDGNTILVVSYNKNTLAVVDLFAVIIDTQSCTVKYKYTAKSNNFAIACCYINSNTIALSYNQINNTPITCLWDINNNTIIKSTNKYRFDPMLINFSSPYLYGFDELEKKDVFLNGTTLAPTLINTQQELFLIKNKRYYIEKSNDDNVVTLYEENTPQEGETLLELLGRWKERNKK